MRLSSTKPVVLAAIAALAAVFAPAGSADAPRHLGAAVVVDPGPGGFTSSNVSYVASIPTGAGVSSRVVTVGGQRRLYVSSAHSLTIYDITDPGLPLPLGVLPIYNWENEDIAVSKDGATTILTEFESEFYLHVVDTSNPRLPILKGSHVLDGAHTAECADVHCHYLFASTGETWDIRDQSNPTPLSQSQSWGPQVGVQDSHNIHQDAAGYWIADTRPMVMFRADNPLHPRRITRGYASIDNQYQHNNVRPAAASYHPRKKGDTSKTLRPGELLMAETETNFSPQCDGQNGSFTTWSMVGWDHAQPMRQLHVLHPVTGSPLDGNAEVNALGCSGHWFTVRENNLGRYKGKYLVAGGWYEHGTRFLAVDPKTGTISQVGYFQPVRGSASAAYWIQGTDYVYVVDYQRGIDILKFDVNAAPPTVAQTNASWLAKLNVIDAVGSTEQFLCQQVMKRESARP
ncbi:MAG: hypothetical protein QOC82_1225 [Frankiaceae bacterium]|jgi:hypothetical protein|nr:hypothetical protein [Frankiaceae bacterium]